MKKQIIKLLKQIIKLLKIKSLVTFSFLIMIFISILKNIELPDWLIPIIVVCLQELFNKDKVNRGDK